MSAEKGGLVWEGSLFRLQKREGLSGRGAFTTFVGEGSAVSDSFLVVVEDEVRTLVGKVRCGHRTICGESDLEQVIRSKVLSVVSTYYSLRRVGPYLLFWAYRRRSNVKSKGKSKSNRYLTCCFVTCSLRTLHVLYFLSRNV